MSRSPESAFVFIHLDEMQDFLHGLSPRFQEMQWEGGELATQERIFGLPLRHHPDVYLLVFTSIVGEWSRELGRDALRVTLFDQRTRCFLGHKTHTKRLSGWQGRLANKIKELGGKISQYVCPLACGGYLTQRKGPTGKFFGCTNYPACRCSRPLLSGSSRPNQL
ncbi:MAG: topoisomerase DNA-binding C4 zinc finger domain-containing protein [Bacteroidota bacterium]|nr:topoisomerase DNA-binding C4 zinc finger domain-containing protein [Bacteroidota bacterium]